MKPLRTLDSAKTRDGLLELKSRGPKDFLITIDNRVLMTSTATRSELALGKVACRRLRGYAQPKVLVGGLGMAFTLRSVLDELPPTGKVVVAELNPIVETWCRGPMADLTNHAAEDPRVKVEFVDVMELVAKAAHGGPGGRYDALVIDLYVGPDAGTRRDDPLYGAKACMLARQSLVVGGVFSIWGESYDEAYVKRLEKVGFSVRSERPGRGGLRHVVYVATAV